MSDADRLLEAFEKGALVRPSADVANLVDLARAVASMAGVDNIDLSPGAERIATQIGKSDHYVFVLVDGLGVGLVDQLPGGSFLRSHMRAELQTVFPSTTVAALTSLATGLWPGEHGVPTWWAYLLEFDVSATVLPFIERFSKRPLSRWGVKSGDVYGATALLTRFPCEVRFFVPTAIATSTYTAYSSGGEEAIPYTTLAGGVEAVASCVASAESPTYSYFYYPVVDAVAHDCGPEHERVLREAVNVDHELARLARALGSRARMIVTADHGLVTIPEEGRHAIRADDELMGLLSAPVSGEPRVPLFHVQDGKGDDFETASRERYGELFALLTASEVEELCLFGPEPLADATRARLGDFVGLALGADVLVYEPQEWMTGFHAGLTAAEMRVPLMVA